MQIKETLNKGLKREFDITIPAKDIEAKLVLKLESIGKKVKMPGFRPGKIPLPLLKQRYNADALSEVLKESVDKAVEKVIKDHKLKPALRPDVNIKKYDEGKNLDFHMQLEVLPTLGEIKLDNLAFEKLVVQIPNEQITKTLDNIAKQNRETQPIKKPRKTAKGDIVVIDFEGFIGKDPIQGGAAKNHHLELGSGSFIPGFEDQLTGQDIGKHIKVNVKFPKDYHNEAYANKDASFDVTIIEIHEAAPVKLNDDLAKKIGFQTLAEMKEWVEKSLSKDYEAQSFLNTKRHVLDVLSDRFKFEVPENMVSLEFDNIWKQLCNELGISQDTASNKNEKEKPKSFEDATGKSEKELREEYKIIAERRVRLGILLAEIGNVNKIGVTNQELSSALIAKAREYPGQEKEAYEFFKSNEAALASIRAPLFENKVIEFILSKSKINEKPLSPEAFEKFLLKEEEEAERNILASQKKTKKAPSKKEKK